MCLEEGLEHISKKENGAFEEGGAHDYSSKKTKEVLPGIVAQLLSQSLGCVSIQFFSGLWILRFCLLIIHSKGPSCHRLEICK